jgi:hypothetical protein
VNREVGRVESKIRMEYSHEHIPPFVDSTYSEATDIAIESNYTVESALSDNDAHVNSLLFPMPPGGLESSALNTSNASSRNLSAHIHSIALDVDRAVVRLDEDAQEPGWKVRDSAADSREEDKGENLAVFSGSPPGSPRRPEAEAQNPNSAEGADTTRRCGPPSQQSPPHDGELPATASPMEPSMATTECATTGALRSNDFTPSIQHDEVRVDWQSLQLSINHCESPIRRAQSALPASSGDVERRSDPEDELAPRSGTSNDADQDGRDQIIHSISPDGDRSNDVAAGGPQNTTTAALHQEGVPADKHPTSNSTYDVDGPTPGDVSTPSVVPTLGFDSLSSGTDSSIAPSSPRSELGISAQFSDVGDDTRSEVSAASQVPAAPSSPRSVTNEDFFTPALRTLWKLETPVTPTGTSKVQLSPSTPALTVGRTDNGFDSNLVTPVVPQPEGLPQERPGLSATKAEHATSSLWDPTIGIVRVSDTSADALPQIVAAKTPSAFQTPKYKLAGHAPPGLDTNFTVSLDRNGRTDVNSRGANNAESCGKIAESGDNIEMPNVPKACSVHVVSDRLSAVSFENPGSQYAPPPQSTAVADTNGVRATGSSSLASDTTESISITPSNISSLGKDMPAHTIVVEQNGSATESQAPTTASGTAIAPVRTYAEVLTVADRPGVDDEPSNPYQAPPSVEDATLPIPAGESTRPIDARGPLNDVMNAEMAILPAQMETPALCCGSDPIAEPVLPIHPYTVESEAIDLSEPVTNTFDPPFSQNTPDKSVDAVEPHIVASSASVSNPFDSLKSLDTPAHRSEAAESQVSAFPKTVLEPASEPSARNMPDNHLELVKPRTITASEPVSNSSDQLFPQAPPADNPNSVELQSIATKPVSESFLPPTHGNIGNETPGAVEPHIVTSHSFGQLISQATAVDAPDLVSAQVVASSKPTSESLDPFIARKIRNNNPEVVEPQAVAPPELVSNPFVPVITQHSSANNPEGAESQVVASSSTVLSSFEEPILPNVLRDIPEDIEPQAVASESAVNCFSQPIVPGNPADNTEVVKAQVATSSPTVSTLSGQPNHHNIPADGLEVTEPRIVFSAEPVSTPFSQLIPPHAVDESPQAERLQGVPPNLHHFEHPIPQDAASDSHSTTLLGHMLADASEELPSAWNPLQRSPVPDGAHAADAILAVLPTDVSSVEINTADTVCALLCHQSTILTIRPKVSSSSWTWSTVEQDAGVHELAATASSILDPLSESEVSPAGDRGMIQIGLKCVTQTGPQSNRWSWSTSGTLDVRPIDVNPFRSLPSLRPSNPIPQNELSDASMSDSELPTWKEDLHLPDPPQSPLSTARYAPCACHYYTRV